jgi:hypothetical protein
MANISVVELLSDPDFVDPVTVVRKIESVGNDGIAVYLTQTIPILASIQANSGDNLFTDPDRARAGGSYEVITSFPLAVATDTTSADTVLWRGSEFVVTSIARFGNFAGGAGHYEGTMEIKTISPPIGPP